MTKPNRYPWFCAGDLNAFFGLMFDNVTNLVLLTQLLCMKPFEFPKEFIYTFMFPGTALGVMIGDLVYSWMAFRLAKRTGRTDITAMPLGLDTPSTIGIAVAVIGPVYLASHDPMVAWQVGMATMILIGVVKVVFSFTGEWIRRIVPQAGLLGSLAGIGIALLGFFPLVKMFQLPVVGLVAFGIVFYTLIAKVELPFKLPGAAVAVIVGIILYYALGECGLIGTGYHLPQASTLSFSLPQPTLGFVEGLERALGFLPLAIPFGILTIVGGINTTESARVAGDEYNTRDILLTEALSTLVAGLFGGVAQSTPYIGHPAYKAMGGRVGYTLATALFIGLGGVFGVLNFIVDAIPAAAVVPILIFVGMEIVSQAFGACPKNQFPAVTLSFLPIVAFLVMSNLGAGLATHPDRQVITALGNGFILTAMLWGGFGAHVIEKKLLKASAFLGVCALFSWFGMIHSVMPEGRLYLPWQISSSYPYELAAGYGLLAGIFLVLHLTKRPAASNSLGK